MKFYNHLIFYLIYVNLRLIKQELKFPKNKHHLNKDTIFLKI